MKTDSIKSAKRVLGRRRENIVAGLQTNYLPVLLACSLAIFGVSSASAAGVHFTTSVGKVMVSSHGHSDSRDYHNRKYDNQRHSTRHHHDDRRYRAQPITLSVKIRANGDQTIPLRRLIEDRYNVNTRDYRLKSVSVRNKARYPAYADLRIGKRSTGIVDLHRGITHIRAPRGQSNGRWMLDVGSARVRAITVQLVPKTRAIARHHRDKYDRHAFADKGSRSKTRDYRYRKLH